jgi:hypothetical protein
MLLIFSGPTTGRGMVASRHHATIRIGAEIGWTVGGGRTFVVA